MRRGILIASMGFFLAGIGGGEEIQYIDVMNPNATVQPVKTVPVRPLPPPTSATSSSPTSSSTFQDPTQVPGTVKVSTIPIRCTILFRGERYFKDKGVLVFENVPPGHYTLVAQNEEGSVEKTVIVRPKETTVVVANLRKTPGESGVEQAGRLVPRQYTEADDLYALAEVLRSSPNPFRKAARYQRAEELYRRIIERYPDSDKVILAHYQLGNIYESVFYKKYADAINEYKRVIERDFDTALDVRWRIAALYEDKLLNLPAAREWYELCAKYTKDPALADRAAARAAALKAKGF